MIPTSQRLIPYKQIREEFANHPVRRSEIPIEHSISLPVPTKRWTVPGFASFAGPAARQPGQPLRLGSPDRWWAVHAWQRRLLAYALTSVVPFTAEDLGDEIVVNTPQRSVEALSADLDRLDELFDNALPGFFAGTEVAPNVRRNLFETFTAHVTVAVLPWYRALAPDFFIWLEDGASQ